MNQFYPIAKRIAKFKAIIAGLMLIGIAGTVISIYQATRRAG